MCRFRFWSRFYLAKIAKFSETSKENFKKKKTSQVIPKFILQSGTASPWVMDCLSHGLGLLVHRSWTASIMFFYKRIPIFIFFFQ